MSIKTKVILAMASLAVVITMVLFVVANTVTSSSINDTINLAGITYTKTVQAAGEQYSSQINEASLIARLQQEIAVNPDGEVGKYWSDGILRGYQLTDHYKLAHPDGAYPSISSMVKDLQWVRTANIVEMLINPEKKTGEEREAQLINEGSMNSVAKGVLGVEWEKSYDAITSPPRSLLRRPTPEDIQFFPTGEDLSKERQPFAIENLKEYVGTDEKPIGQQTASRVTDLFRTLVKKVQSDGNQRLAGLSKMESGEPQVVGVRFEPKTIDLGYLKELSPSAIKAESFTLNTYEGSGIGLSGGEDSGEPGIQFTVGTDSNSKRELRVYRTSDGKVGNTFVFLDPVVLDDARSKTLLWIGLVTLGSLTIAVVMAFLLGGGITKPVTALMKDVSIIASGNFQHRPNIKSKDEVGALGTLIGEMAASLEIGATAWRENQSVMHDIDMAREIQENLLPKQVPEIKGYDISAFYSPSKEVGGDYYDFFQIDEHHLGIICADVSGKGIPGSMVMMMTKALITYVAQGNTSPKDVFCKVNQIVAKDIKRGMFVTAYYAVLDLRTRQMQVVSAGHNPMVLYRGKTKTCEEVNPGGIALGFDKDGKLFERNMQEQTVQLNRGDRVVIYTDGIIEAAAPDETAYGIESLKEFTMEMAQAESPDYLQNLVSEIDGFTQVEEQGDDITVISLRVV